MSKTLINKFCILLFAIIIAYRELGSYLFNFDLTTAILVITFITFTNYLFSPKIFKFSTNFILTCAFILLFMILSLLWTRSFDYGFRKLVLFTLPLFITIFISSETIKNIRYFQIIIVVIAILTSISLINQDSLEFSKYFRLVTEEGTNPIKLAKYLVFSIISFFFLFKNKLTPFWFYISLFSVCVFFGLVIFLTGSKGPIFSLFLTILIIILLHSKNVIKNAFFVLVTVYLLYLFAIELTNIVPSELQAFFDRRYNLETDEASSISLRLDMVIFTITDIFERGLFFNFFGHGIGDFLFAYGKASYPHNIILEVFYEYGIVGTIFLGFILLFLYNRIREYKQSSIIVKYLIVTTLFFFLTAQSTGDISGNYTFVAFFIILYLAHKNKYLLINHESSYS